MSDLSRFRKGMQCLLMLIIFMSFSVVFAGDGQIDILPNGTETYVISKSGSYVLTGNVDMTANVDCIKITCIDVTLDMNGHSITGTGAGNIYQTTEGITDSGTGNVAGTVPAANVSY